MMKQNKIEKTNLFLIFLILFFSSDTLLFGTIDSRFLTLFGYCVDIGFIVLIPIIMFMRGKRLKLRQRESRITIVLIGALILSSLVNGDIRGGYIMSIAMALFAFIVSEEIAFEDFSKAFALIMFILALCSIVGFTIFSIVPELNKYGFIAKNYIGTTFYHYLLYMHCTDSIGASRNWSIFREPGIYQIYLIIALLIELYYYDKKEKKRGVLVFGTLIIAILTTKSTTGYVALLLVILYFLLKENYLTNHRKVQNLFISIGLLLCVFFVLLVNWSHYFFELIVPHLDKFNKASIKYHSFYARFSSIGINAYLWILNPLFGNGITKKDVLFSKVAKMLYGIENSCDTNTILAQFSIYGIIVGVIWIYAIVNMSRKVAETVMERSVLIVLFALLLMTEFVIFSPLSNLFIWYGIQRNSSGRSTEAYKMEKVKL